LIDQVVIALARSCARSLKRPCQEVGGIDSLQRGNGYRVKG